MNLIPEVKCSRCDRMYPGLRTRCPYCGARKGEKSKRAADDASLWKMMISVSLVGVLIIGIVVSLAASGREKREADAAASASAYAAAQAAAATPTVRVTMPPSPSPSATAELITIENLQLMYGGEEIEKAGVEGVDYIYDITLDKDMELPVSVVVTPVIEGVIINWTSSDTKVLTIEEIEGLDAVLVPGSEGEATLTIGVEGSSAAIKALIRVNG